MRTHDHRTLRLQALLAAGALLLALSLGLAPAIAEVPVGEDAPDVEAKDFLNTSPLKLSDLSGRLILLELFTTT